MSTSIWVDWIPSPQGQFHYQRLVLDSYEKKQFAWAARDSIRCWLPLAAYPEWHSEGSNGEFEVWKEQLKQGLQLHKQNAENFRNSLEPLAPSANWEFWKSRTKILAPRIKQHCIAASKAMIALHGLAPTGNRK